MSLKNLFIFALFATLFVFVHAADGEIEMESSVEPSPEANACFPSDALVTVPSGVKRISEVEIGDRVLVAPGVFSEVVMFTHRNAEHKGSFIELNTAKTTIQLTTGHFIYANGNLIPAKAVRTGDAIVLADGSSATVNTIRTVFNIGLFNPQTAHGDIIVNGVQASTYTTAIEPNTAHTLLAPVRAMLRAGGVSALDSLSGLFGTVST